MWESKSGRGSKNIRVSFWELNLEEGRETENNMGGVWKFFRGKIVFLFEFVEEIDVAFFFTDVSYLLVKKHQIWSWASIPETLYTFS